MNVPKSFRPEKEPENKTEEFLKEPNKQLDPQEQSELESKIKKLEEKLDATYTAIEIDKDLDFTGLFTAYHLIKKSCIYLRLRSIYKKYKKDLHLTDEEVRATLESYWKGDYK